MSAEFQLAPVAASAMAERVDVLFYFMLAFTGLLAFTLAALIVFLSIRYRRGSNVDRTHPPLGGRPLEIAWTVIPIFVFGGVFAWAAYDYADMHRPPADAMPVFVVAKQWMWKLQHDNGKREINELHVPLGRPVRLVMTSQDVIHSFFVPAFRMKQDVVPGRYTTIAFTPTRLGEFHLFCAEYCGTDHAHMGGRIVVMRPDAFAGWLAAGAPVSSLAARGFELYRGYGCSGCHEPASTVHAPSLKGLYGRTVHLADGRSVVADEAYIHDSILLPKRDVVAGFDPVMPSFAGQIAEEDIAALIAYIRSTSGDTP